jgi:LysM repeat protein
MRQLISLWIAISMATPLIARPQSQVYTNPEVDELRLEIDDLKHALNTTQVELNLLDEKLNKQNSAAKTQAIAKEMAGLSQLASTVSVMEKKVSKLEKILEKITNDLRTLNTSTHQTQSKLQAIEMNLSSHDQRLGEVTKLEKTLHTISKAIGKESPSQATSTKAKSYRVKAGDSLDKIAKTQHISIEALRKINNLTSDKIMIGQELKVIENGS